MTDPWQPVTLTGGHVSLEPLEAAHGTGLRDAVRDGQLWQLWYTVIPEPARMHAEIDRRLALQAAGSMLPFTVIAARSGRIVGMTSYMDIDRSIPRLEIGSTWQAHSAQRTPINTEAKLLLLRHAYRTLGCAVVTFRTHALNRQSRRAIERLGAKLDGDLRNHTRMPNGTLRDTAAYSITDAEWPTVEAHLEWLLQQCSEDFTPGDLV